ncbi:Aldehyde/histidinol dehydrogenase [Xylariaceae sp. FL1272]|nr:Aldehyde/histidinol dehydrogenase [Xylariaceae sp. FL1272]
MPSTTSNYVDSLAEQQQLFIDGEHCPSSDGATFSVNNPMTGKHIYDCSAATQSDYARAIDSASEAFKTWSTTSPTTRRQVFLKAADILEGYIKGDAPSILSSEISATNSWVKVNIFATVGVFRESAGLVTHIKGEIVPADRPGTTLLVQREAIGVIFAISPWNAPVNLTARAIATPLICGNTIVLKPSEFSPKSQHLVVRALQAAGLPKGCLNFLPTAPANSPAVTEFTVKHPVVRRINFTGSDRVGRIIAGWAASQLKPCVFELGGKAPVIIFDDANIDDAVDAVVFGALAYSGQICMSTERVIVQKSIAETFRTALIEKVKTLKVGNHEQDPEVSISGLFTQASATRVLGLVKGAVSAGAKLLYGDMQVSGPNKTIIMPHILEGLTKEMDISCQEIFGPLICLSEFETEEEGIAIANDSEYSLCASVFSKDIIRALRVTKLVRAGACHINGPSVYIEAPLPNGGTGGSSGYGRFGGIAGVEEFTERKIVTLASPDLRHVF